MIARLSADIDCPLYVWGSRARRSFAGEGGYLAAYNGDPLTAADVTFSLDKMLGPKVVPSYVGRLRQQMTEMTVS